ncbi:MAG: hypothetical protein UV60_C0001G0038 [Parcubacteria group bacterium GW2011_GWA2_43_11]|nr:MAG: hypothetical protein UU89_C0025G0020 [Parcubacteria group bacterium GW2011_GWC2_42_11]KKS86439.1 MAG: hypothetical protein UV60_C0001G0038 [Parcubacteria group bacterium GW2011_GWA2_43_11]
MNNQAMLFITLGGGRERKNWLSGFFATCSITDNDGTRYLDDSELPNLSEMRTDAIDDWNRFSRICSFSIARSVAEKRRQKVLSMELDGKDTLHNTLLRSYVCLLG